MFRDDQVMTRIILSGSTGFIGKALTTFLESQGHEVVKYSSRLRSGCCRQPEMKADIVIHLEGEPLAGRWTAAKRMRILKSRIESTYNLVKTLNANPPKLFICASAIGFYGDRADAMLTEDSPRGRGFLSAVCEKWESIARQLKGSRVVHTRFGIVLGKDGGAVKKMRLPYKLGLGATIGNGKQWMSWIALHDLLRAIDFIIQNESLSGPVNLTSPNPVPQKEFSDTLARSLHRKAFLRMPKWLVKLLFGQMGEEMLLFSDRVIPKKLIDAGFTFSHPDLEETLSHL